jgi:hypothetical protein
LYIILTGRAWIPAFAGMTRSGNRQSINRIGITCAEAFELAKNFETEIIEIGRICNQNNIRICKCHLGCFG